MRAIVTTRNGDVRALKIEERPDPIPSKGQVLIRVKASGLNFADILARQGLYPDGPPKPCVMGYEVSGFVEAAGVDVDRSLIGKAVIAMTRFGGQAELIAKQMELISGLGERIREGNLLIGSLQRQLALPDGKDRVVWPPYATNSWQYRHVRSGTTLCRPVRRR